MENTFKEGDHVRVIGVGVIAYTDEKLAAGQTGVISCVIAKGVGYEVLMDNGHVSDPSDPTWPFFHNELELVE